MVRDYANLSSGNREKDANGFLRVQNCLLTKAEVNQYYGKEIPGWEELGLNPDEIYDVLRPADEIESSLSQIAMLPILDDHDDIHDAEHPQKHIRIGAIGSDISFEEPEVRGNLAFWNAKEIGEIEGGSRDNLSMGYDYEASLENGTYEGKKYTVRMNNIVWNHVALVDKGRVEGAKVADRALDDGNVQKLKELYEKTKLEFWNLGRPANRKKEFENRLKEINRMIVQAKQRGFDYSPEQAQVYSEYMRLSSKLDPLSREEQNLLNALAKKLEGMGMKRKTGDATYTHGNKKGQEIPAEKKRRMDELEKKYRSQGLSKPEMAEMKRLQRHNPGIWGDEEIAPETPTGTRKKPGVGEQIGNTPAILKGEDRMKRKNGDAIRTAARSPEEIKKEIEVNNRYIRQFKKELQLSGQPKHFYTETKQLIHEWEQKNQALVTKLAKASKGGMGDRIKRKSGDAVGRTYKERLDSLKNTAAQLERRMASETDKELWRNYADELSRIKNSIRREMQNTGDRKMIRKKGRDAEIPAEGEENEEIKENRVVAGIKALLEEFDDTHEEAGIDPGVTDEEAGCLEKVRDFLDSFHNQGSEDEPGEEAGTSMDPMDEDPEEEMEDPEAIGDEDWPDNGSAPTGRGDRRPRGMDAATIERRITAKFRAKDRALDDCGALLGSVSKARTLDSAMDVYAHALRSNGISFPKDANLAGLRGMVQMLKRSRAGDSASYAPTKPSGTDAKIQEMINKSPYAPKYA